MPTREGAYFFFEKQPNADLNFPWKIADKCLENLKQATGQI